MKQNYGKEIKVQKEILKSNINLMEGLRIKFISATIEFFKSWFLAELKRTVKKYSNITNEPKLITEKAGKMKNDMPKLQDEAEEFAQNLLENENLWWHIKQSSQNYSSEFGTINEPIQLIGGKLGQLLKSYGYPKDDWMDYKGDLVYRQEDYGRGPVVIYCWQPRIEWSGQMLKIKKEYAELCNESKEIIKLIKEMEEKKSQDDAEDIFDNA